MTEGDRAVFKDRLNNLAVMVEMLLDDDDLPHFLMAIYHDDDAESPHTALVAALMELVD